MTVAIRVEHLDRGDTVVDRGEERVVQDVEFPSRRVRWADGSMTWFPAGALVEVRS